MRTPWLFAYDKLSSRFQNEFFEAVTGYGSIRERISKNGRFEFPMVVDDIGFAARPLG
jgi:hypothetical protein